MALYIRQLKKQYVSPDGGAVPVLDVPAFDLAGGEQVALIGGSGTGKTTLLHLIAGILAPDSGEILFRFDDEGGGARPGAARDAVASGNAVAQGHSSASVSATGVLPYRSAAAVADDGVV